MKDKIKKVIEGLLNETIGDEWDDGEDNIVGFGINVSPEEFTRVKI